MHIRLTALTFAVIGGALSMGTAGAARAANVGYYVGPSCTFTIGDFAGAITTAGHTPIAVTTLDAPSLTGLGGLVIETCSAAPVANASVNAAVASGMGLVINTWNAGPGSGVALPGAPAATFSSYYSNGFCGLDSSIPAGSPVTSGPGGTLNDSSLDSSGFCALDSFATSNSLPVGAIPFVTTTDANQVGAFGYSSGQGRVAFSSMSMATLLPGGSDSGGAGSLSGGLNTYLINAIAWVAGPTTTCASEGYKG
ncbi:MAG: hypothetical protein KDI69_07135, partial [Xanthomonadales bacterium]|nr:hypothetical protein [Xanthomonadales bacterium]